MVGDKGWEKEQRPEVRPLSACCRTTLPLVYLMCRRLPWATEWLESNWGQWLLFWHQGYYVWQTFSLTYWHAWYSHPTLVMMSHHHKELDLLSSRDPQPVLPVSAAFDPPWVGASGKGK